MDVVFGFLLIFLVVCAGFATFAKTTIQSIIFMSVFSSCLAIIFLILQAPDVAMVEAVIGAGLLTAFYIVAMNKTRK